MKVSSPYWAISNSNPDTNHLLPCPIANLLIHHSVSLRNAKETKTNIISFVFNSLIFKHTKHAYWFCDEESRREWLIIRVTKYVWKPSVHVPTQTNWRSNWKWNKNTNDSSIHWSFSIHQVSVDKMNKATNEDEIVVD